MRGLKGDTRRKRKGRHEYTNTRRDQNRDRKKEMTEEKNTPNTRRNEDRNLCLRFLELQSCSLIPTNGLQVRYRCYHWPLHWLANHK